MRGKRVLVSGGSAGIGFAAAKLFARRGASVAITGRSAERGGQALQEMRGISADCIFLHGDAGVPQDVARVTREAAHAMGGIDVLISAGAGHATGNKLFESLSIEEIRETFEHLVFPRILPVHAAIPHLKGAGGGSIVMITTDAARHATPGESMVGATGAMTIMLTKVLARELSRDRVRVNSVALTLTSGTPGWDMAFAHEFSRKVFQKAVERFPFGRPPDADEVAQAMVFLASDEAGQVSGQTLSVNGALSFGGW